MRVSSMPLRKLSVILGLAWALSACSTIAELDPTGLLSDDTGSSQPASQFPADQSAPTASDQAQGTTPSLASIPAKPATPSASDQSQATEALANEGVQARYSAQALRGGTEAAAPPPTTADLAPTAAQSLSGTAPQPSSASNAPPTAEAAPPTAEAAPPAAQPVSPAPAAAAQPPQMAAGAPQLPEGAQPAVPPAASGNVQAASAASAANAAAPVGPSAVSASATPPMAASSNREPAVPPNAGRATAMASQVSDAALGFRPSDAPPLASSVAEFASAPVVALYRQTASNAEIAVASASTAAVPAVPASNGAVVANSGALSGATAAIAAMNGGVAPTAVIYFPDDGTGLSAAARSQVRSAADAFKHDGGQGTVRVVGHASSRTANMPVEKHLETIFDKSQARANAVARELIKDGVPASKVLIDAVGDSQPIYYESMPEGEVGNRRAEIFVQG